MFAETPAWPASALDRWPGVFPNGVFIHLHLCEQQSCWTRVKNPMFSAEVAHRSVFLLIHHPGVAFTSSAKTHGIPSTLSATEAANGAAVARSCSPPAQPEPDGASPPPLLAAAAARPLAATAHAHCARRTATAAPPRRPAPPDALRRREWEAGPWGEGGAWRCSPGGWGARP